jgi:hypothetical protein
LTNQHIELKLKAAADGCAGLVPLVASLCIPLQRQDEVAVLDGRAAEWRSLQVKVARQMVTHGENNM